MDFEAHLFLQSSGFCRTHQQPFVKLSRQFARLNLISNYVQFACGFPKNITREQSSIVFYGDPFVHDD